MLAPVAGVLVDIATLTAPAYVSGCGTNAPSEETLAGFAAQDTKVISGGGVVADSAYLL